MDDAGLKALLARGNVSAVRQNITMNSKPVGKPKYNAQQTAVDGVNFASKKEARHWQTLRALEIAGQIRELRRQTVFPLDVNGVHIADYHADFSYEKAGALVVEDAKGMKKGTPYELFKLKARLMLACHGIEVKEV